MDIIHQKKGKSKEKRVKCFLFALSFFLGNDPEFGEF
jgi:hypothetical protein